MVQEKTNLSAHRVSIKKPNLIPIDQKPTYLPTYLPTHIHIHMMSTSEISLSDPPRKQILRVEDLEAFTNGSQAKTDILDFLGKLNTAAMVSGYSLFIHLASLCVCVCV
jgi:hypothetical protein